MSRARDLTAYAIAAAVVAALAIVGIPAFLRWDRRDCEVYVARHPEAAAEYSMKGEC